MDNVNNNFSDQNDKVVTVLLNYIGVEGANKLLTQGILPAVILGEGEINKEYIRDYVQLDPNTYHLKGETAYFLEPNLKNYKIEHFTIMGDSLIKCKTFCDFEKPNDPSNVILVLDDGTKVYVTEQQIRILHEVLGLNKNQSK